MSKNPKLKQLISEVAIAKQIKILATQITQDYKEKDFIIIAVLNGSFVFLADLIRQIPIDHKVDFIGASSYGDGLESSGRVKITKNLTLSPYGKSILLVEDIVETGNTLNHLTKILLDEGANDVQICSLLGKKKNGNFSYPVKYLGFEIEDRFIVGYGLDYAGSYRNLPYIGELIWD